MQMRCERRGQSEVRGATVNTTSTPTSGPGSEPGTRRAERLVHGHPHECDGCGETAPDVDLWAENSETGEQIWLCMTCGGW